MTETTQAWAISDYGAVETLTPIDLPLPRPAAGEMLVAVEAMALNPLDLKIMSGRMKDMMPAAMPYVPGSDFVGTVADSGPGAPAGIGERVIVSSWNGGLARTALVPASAHIVAVPADLPAADLAALPMAALTANFILRAIGEVQGRTIAILGATGGVGLALTQLATRQGAIVIGSAGSPEDAALLTANGAAETIAYADGAFVPSVRAKYPTGVDVMIDLVSMFDALVASAEAVRDGGLLLATLFGPEPETFGDRITMRYIRLKSEPGDLAAIAALYAAGSLRANVTRRFAFDQARDAYLALRDDHVRGKIVVTM